MKRAFAHYRGRPEFAGELHHYTRLGTEGFATQPEREISSSGYVVHCLEASLWCLLNTDTYRAAALKAVNLGSDTDTTAAVTGGLAGLLYGYGAIPPDWLGVLARREWVEELCVRGTRLRDNEQL